MTDSLIRATTEGMKEKKRTGKRPPRYTGRWGAEVETVVIR